MKRNHRGNGTGILPLRPLKKQKLRSNEGIPISSVHSHSTHETNLNLATPLRRESSNSHWVTPRVQEPHRDHNQEAGCGSLLTPKNQDSTHQDCPMEVSPLPEQKENLPNRFHSPRISSKEKNRKQLKAVLLRNGQNVTGTVKVLQNRVADGEARGKLGICPKCGGGKLKIEDRNPHQVYCSRKLLCGFQCHAHTAPRSGPWTCVSFDDDQDDLADTTDLAAPTKAASKSGNTATSAVGHTPDKHIPIRPRYQMPSPYGPSPMYHGYPGYSSPPPPPPYWNGQHGPPHPPTPQRHAQVQGPYSFYYPPPLAFPQHPRQPLHPMQMAGYPPMPPHGTGPPTVFRHPENVPNSGGQTPNRENVAPTRPWFPLSDPAYFPDRGAPIPSRPEQKREIETNDQDHPKNPGACNHTPAEVAMATKAAKKVLKNTKPADGAKHVWSAEEDEVVRNAVSGMGSRSFNAWTTLVPFLPGRTGKQIRDRWINHLNPHLIHTPFDRDEDLLLWNAFLKFGKSWKEISTRHFHSRRSENKIKNRWHSTAYQKFIASYVGEKEYERALSRSEEG